MDCQQKEEKLDEKTEKILEIVYQKVKNEVFEKMHQMMKKKKEEKKCHCPCCEKKREEEEMKKNMMEMFMKMMKPEEKKPCGEDCKKECPIKKNIDLVKNALNSMFVLQDALKIDEFFSENLIQHNPHIPNGSGAIKYWVSNLKKEHPDFKCDSIRFLGEGDLVVVHSRYTGWMPTPVIVFDLFRIENGKIIEHWDCIQNEVLKTASGRTMIDGTVEICDFEKTQENKKIVMDMINEVFIGHKFDKLASYFKDGIYQQHNPYSKDNLSGLFEAFEALGKQGMAINYEKLHKLIGCGNFVFAQGSGKFGEKKTVYNDLFRIENGKVIEHWDVLQDLIEQTKSGNPMV